jgi:hypothetical protein
MTASSTFVNRRQPGSSTGRHDRRMVLRRKPKPIDNSSAVRVRPGVESVVYDAHTASFTVLVPGSVFASDNPVVSAHSWAFEPTDDPLADELAGADVTSVSLAPPRVDYAAQERLNGVMAEIASLSERIAPPKTGVDVDALAGKLLERNARREALELTVPALEREVLVSKYKAAERRAELDGEAYERAALKSNEAKETFLRANPDMQRAVQLVANASRTMDRSQAALADAEAALARHDNRHNFDVDIDDAEVSGSEAAVGPLEPATSPTEGHQ